MHVRIIAAAGTLTFSFQVFPWGLAALHAEFGNGRRPDIELSLHSSLCIKYLNILFTSHWQWETNKEIQKKREGKQTNAIRSLSLDPQTGSPVIHVYDVSKDVE